MIKDKMTYNDLKSYLEQHANNRTKFTSNEPIPIERKIITDKILLDSRFSIDYNNCEFLEEFTIATRGIGPSTSEKLSFKNCKFLKTVNFAKTTELAQIIFENCEFKEEIKLEKGTIHEIHIYSSIHIEKIIIGNVKAKRIEIIGDKTSTIKGLAIINSNSIDKARIEKFKIHKANFSRNLPQEIEIFNCSSNSIYFDSLRNNGVLKLVNCKALPLKGEVSHFGISNSNLGKAEFFQVDFSGFDEVNIIDSILFECLFINTTWSNNIKSFYSDQMDNYKKDRIFSKNPIKKLMSKLFKSKIYYHETMEQLKNKREVYKQLKYALSKQGDFVNEQMFHGLEMNTYYKILSWKKYRNLSTKFILKLSLLTSNYGQSLLRPLLTLVIVNILLFSWFNYLNGSYFIPLSEMKYSDINNNILQFIQYFLQHLNPLHKIDESSRLAMFIDILNKIVMAYVIYNIIRATRRFIK